MPNFWPAEGTLTVESLAKELESSNANLELLAESFADAELALEDRGWLALNAEAGREFTRSGKRNAGTIARFLAAGNPLIKRGVGVRTAYIWGQGVEIQARATGDSGEQDVNSVIQRFLEANAASFSSSQAHEEAERQLATDGDLFHAHFTSPLTGRVVVRSFSPDEIEEIIPNPEDRGEPWFYLRQYTITVIEPGAAGGTRSRRETRRELYPALNYRPTVRPKEINNLPIIWDAPILHTCVNRFGKWLFGVGDAYAAIFFSRAYKEFLEDWSKLTKSLARYAWKVTGAKSATARNAANTVRTANSDTGPNKSAAGATAAMAGAGLEAVSKTGATIDAESGRPLAGMVAAAFGIPVTMLLSDPGQTGARAVAETLDEPMRLEILMRQSLHASAFQQTFDYVIKQAVRSPRGPLKGTIIRDEYDREVVTLASDTDPTVEVTFPSLDKVSVDVIMKAIVEADGTGKVPPLVILRLILIALGVKDIDEILDETTDDDGNFIDPDASAGQAAADDFRAGNDPAELLR